MTSAVVSAADARYGNHLINLVGSIQRRSNIFDRVVVYDLGLSPLQRWLLDRANGVEVRTVPPFAPHWRQGRTWKTWIWTHLHPEADVVVWLDAGTTVLRPLDDFLAGIEERGYFVVSQGVPNRDCIPTDYYALYDLPESIGDEPTIAAGILGFDTRGDFFSRVIVPTYEDALLGRSLGFSADEVEKLNRGLDRMPEVIVRDCRLFRHEQTLLGIHFYTSVSAPHVEDVFKFGGWRSTRDHPEQVIWSHRRRGDFRFLPRVSYTPAAAVIGLPWGTMVYLRALARDYRWLVRPSFHAHLARRALSRAFPRPR
jgi:hypothetical protein